MPIEGTPNMTLEDHERLFMEIRDSVKRMFNDSSDGNLLPMMHVIDKEGKHLVFALAMNFRTPKEKDILERLQVMMALDDVQAICFFSEAWAVHGVDNIRNIIPAEHPSRIECINLMYCTPTKERMATAKIYRPPRAAPFISVWEEFATCLPHRGDIEKGIKAEANSPWMEAQWPAGRFNGTWLKAERLRKFCKRRGKNIEKFVDKYRSMLNQVDKNQSNPEWN